MGRNRHAQVYMKEKTSIKSNCFALTSNDLLDAALIPERFCAGREEFETAHGQNNISIWKYANGAFAIEAEIFTQTAFPHKQIKTFCCGKNKTEVIFNFAHLLTYSFQVEAIDYSGKRKLDFDLIYAKLPNPKLFIPFAVQESILDLLESI